MENSNNNLDFGKVSVKAAIFGTMSFGFEGYLKSCFSTGVSDAYIFISTVVHPLLAIRDAIEEGDCSLVDRLVEALEKDSANNKDELLLSRIFLDLIKETKKIFESGQDSSAIINTPEYNDMVFVFKKKFSRNKTSQNYSMN